MEPRTFTNPERWTMWGVVLIIILCIIAVFLLTPLPVPKIKVTAPTPESMLREMQREKMQQRYDAAEETAARVLRRNGCDDEWAEAVGHAAVDHRVPVRILAAMAFVESTCDPRKVSRTKDVGLLQVNLHFWGKHWTKAQLLNPYTNAEAGATILAGYLHGCGLREGLHRYNGLGGDGSYEATILAKAGLNG